MSDRPIRAMIVDDEPNNRENLNKFIEDYCPGLDVICLCGSALDARKMIVALKPDLLFLDIEMPDGDGFSLLESLPTVDFEVIFVTAHINYAIKAIKFSALDYIVKPIDKIELLSAVDKACLKILGKRDDLQIRNLIANNSRSDQQKMLALPLFDKIEFVEISHIVRCESDGNYTVFHLSDGEKLIISKTLKEYDELLSSFGFLRTHQSHLINLRHVKSFVKSDGGYILMKDGSCISVSRQRRELVINTLNNKNIK